MSGRDFAMKLARLLAAVAWADGELSDEEIAAFRELLFAMPELTSVDRSELESRMASPVDAEERARLLADLLGATRGEADRERIAAAVASLAESDGQVPRGESRALARIREALDGSDEHVVSYLVQVIVGAIARRSQADWPAGADRDEDGYENADGLYHELLSRLRESDEGSAAPDDDETSKLCMAAVLVGALAWIDEGLSDVERRAIEDVFKSVWGLSPVKASLLRRVCESESLMDADRRALYHSYRERADEEERRTLLRCLLQVSEACSRTSPEEIDEIRALAAHLDLDEEDIEAARRDVCDEDSAPS